MLEAGEDAMYCCRRVIRMAVEDIGLAAPEALNLCLSARDALHFLGVPEGYARIGAGGRLPGARTEIECRLQGLHGRAGRHREKPPPSRVPLHLRNAPTKLMKELDYGRDYRYAHDEPGRVADMDCLPPSLAGRRYYQPTQEGRERQLGQRMEEIARDPRRASRAATLMGAPFIAAPSR